MVLPWPCVNCSRFKARRVGCEVRVYIISFTRSKELTLAIDEISEQENDSVHEKWCNDLAAKLLCVLVLDRFGDFVSDQVLYSFPHGALN